MRGDPSSLLERLFRAAALLFGAVFLLSWALRLLAEMLPTLLILASIAVAIFVVVALRRRSQW